jgi:hypothetical protein
MKRPRVSHGHLTNIYSHLVIVVVSEIDRAITN